jgi:hypothetical protein
MIKAPFLAGEAGGEILHEPGRALDLQLAGEDAVQQALFLGQELDPGLAVGGELQVGLALMALAHLPSKIDTNRSVCNIAK